MSQNTKKRKYVKDQDSQIGVSESVDSDEKVSPPNKIQNKMVVGGFHSEGEAPKIMLDLVNQDESENVNESVNPEGGVSTEMDSQKEIDNIAEVRSIEENLEVVAAGITKMDKSLKDFENKMTAGVMGSQSTPPPVVPGKEVLGLDFLGSQDVDCSPVTLVKTVISMLPESQPELVSNIDSELNTFDSPAKDNIQELTPSPSEKSENSKNIEKIKNNGDSYENVPKVLEDLGECDTIKYTRSRANSLPNLKKLKSSVSDGAKLSVRTRSMRRIDNSQEEENKMGGSVDNIIISTLTREMRTMKTTLLSEFGKRLTSMEKKIDRKLEEQKLANEKRITAVETKLSQCKTDLEGKIEKLDTKVKNNKISSENFEKQTNEKIKNVNLRLGQHENNLKVINNNLSKVESNLDAKIETNKTEIENITSGNELIENDVRALSERLDGLKKEFEKYMQDKDDVMSLEESSGASAEDPMLAKIEGLEKVSRSLKSNIEDLQSQINDLSKKEPETEINNQPNPVAEEIPDDYKVKIKGFERTIDMMQRQISALTPDPCDVIAKCLVVHDLYFDQDENLQDKCKRLIEYIDPDCLPVLDCKRMGTSTMEKPAPCKIALASVSKKIRVLQQKEKVQSNQEFSGVYIRASRDHVERQMRKNLNIVKEYIPNLKRDYRLSAHSLLMEKDYGPGSYAEATRQGRNRGRMRGRSRGSGDGDRDYSRDRNSGGNQGRGGRGFRGNQRRPPGRNSWRGRGRGRGSDNRYNDGNRDNFDAGSHPINTQERA